MTRMLQATRIVLRIQALSLCLAWLSPAGASGIIIQPVVVGSRVPSNPTEAAAMDTLLGEYYSYTQPIYHQIGLDVVFNPYLNQTAPPLSDNVNQNLFPGGWLTFLGDTSYQASPVITVWLISTINGGTSITGNSDCSGGLCGVWITPNAGVDVLAHEVAHLLTNFQALYLPDPGDTTHSTDQYNLLASGLIRLTPTSVGDVYPNGAGRDQIDLTLQAPAMLGSSFVTDIVPEPASTLLFSSGVVFLLALRMRRRTTR